MNQQLTRTGRLTKMKREDGPESTSFTPRLGKLRLDIEVVCPSGCDACDIGKNKILCRCA